MCYSNHDTPKSRNKPVGSAFICGGHPLHTLGSQHEVLAKNVVVNCIVFDMNGGTHTGSFGS